MTISSQTPESDAPELSVALDTLCYIIAKAREFDVKAGSSDPGADPLDDDDGDAVVLEDRPSDPVETELRSIIGDLTVDAQIDLVALMWLGRDDGTLDEWDDIRRTAAEEHNKHTASYLVGTPLLSDHLEAGMDVLGLDCSDNEQTSL